MSSPEVTSTPDTNESTIEIGDNHAEALYAYLVNTAWRAYEKTNEHPQGDAH